MGPGRELSQWPCMKMRRPQKGHSQHQAWSNTGPLLPPLQAYQEMHSLGPPSHSWTPNCWGHSKGPGHKQARLPQDDVGTAQDRA